MVWSLIHSWVTRSLYECWTSRSLIDHSGYNESEAGLQQQETLVLVDAGESGGILLL